MQPPSQRITNFAVGARRGAVCGRKDKSHFWIGFDFSGKPVSLFWTLIYLFYVLSLT